MMTGMDMTLQKMLCLISQDGRSFLDRLTKRGENMDFVKSGTVSMEMSMLVNVKGESKQKDLRMCCSKMAHIRSTKVKTASCVRN